MAEGVAIRIGPRRVSCSRPPWPQRRCGRRRRRASVPACAAVSARNGQRAALIEPLTRSASVHRACPQRPATRRGEDRSRSSGRGRTSGWRTRRSGRNAWRLHLAPLAAHAAIVDQSHGRTILRVTGPKVRDALAKGVPVDLHPRAFTDGTHRRHARVSHRRSALADRRIADLRVCQPPLIWGQPVGRL